MSSLNQTGRCGLPYEASGLCFQDHLQSQQGTNHLHGLFMIAIKSHLMPAKAIPFAHNSRLVNLWHQELSRMSANKREQNIGVHLRLRKVSVTVYPRFGYRIGKTRSAPSSPIEMLKVPSSGWTDALIQSAL